LHNPHLTMSTVTDDSGASRALPLRPVRDLAGIPVRDASGVGIGTIWGALADARTGLIRYVDIALTDSNRHVLVPIGHARLRLREMGAQETDVEGVASAVRTEDLASAYELRLRAALLEELTAIPPYTPDAAVDEQYEHALVRAHGELFHGQRYYAHPAFDHRGFYAGPHPISRDLGRGLDSGLEPLRSLRGFRIARDEPDVRGWPLIGAGGEQLGVIDDLIVDVDAEQVRYVAVRQGTRRVLLPIGFLTIDTDHSRVMAPALLAADLTELPAWSGSTVERPEEEELRDALDDIFHGTRRYELPDFQLIDERDAVGSLE
jgi:hypothetical protein